MADGNAVRAVSKLGSQTLTDALIAAQTEFEAVIKDKQGNRGKYAPLDAVLDSVRPVLNRHGIALMQVTDIREDWLVLRTILRHAGGMEQESLYPVCAVGKTPQETGSALTYARRYALLAICGVHPEDEDDDGEKGARAAGPPAPRFDTKVADVMRKTLHATASQQELAAWLTAHRDNMGRVAPDERDALRAEYARRLKSFPEFDVLTGEVDG